MIRRDAKARSGITLTEILISIMILGVGVISLATLFPLGLIRLRNAQRMTRGQFMRQSAAADLSVTSFMGRKYFHSNPPVRAAYTTSSRFYMPYLQDTPGPGKDWFGTTPGTDNGVYMGAGGDGTFGVTGLPYRYGQGLPVAYDPLWRAVVAWSGGVGLYPDPTGTNPEARFGSGVGPPGTGFVRNDPNAGGGSAVASAHGLQRVTSLPSTLNSTVLQTFVSPEDFVLQDPKGTYALDARPTVGTGLFVENGTGTQLTTPSPLVPSFTVDPTLGVPVAANDWRFTWFFTGQLANASDETRFEGSLVVCENRPFGLDLDATTGSFRATGETVVEAVWGYSSNPDLKTRGVVFPGFPNVGYPHPSGRRTVLLRWPASMPDPDLKVGNWIADVTYERTQAVLNAGRFPYLYPPQRCYWYRVAKRTEPVADPGFPSDPPNTAFRRVTIWVNEPLRAITPLSFLPNGGAEPFHVEAGLIMPSVVDVKPVAFQAH